MGVAGRIRDNPETTPSGRCGYFWAGSPATVSGALVLPHADEVLVRWMSVDGVPAATVARWREVLHPDELARAERFRFDADRTAYIGVHALLRSVLADVGPYPAGDWRFVTEPGGKPGVDPALASSLRFNLSRCRGLVAVAVSDGDDVGIDVESRDRAHHVADLAPRHFTPDEVALIGDSPDTFVRLWTLKEAVVKATGEGLRRPLDSFAVTLEPLTVTFPDGTGAEPGGWQFFEAQPTADHMVAVAVRRVRGPQVSVVPAAVTPDALSRR